MMMANMKAALQILDKSPHWKHPILQHNSLQMHCGYHHCTLKAGTEKGVQKWGAESRQSDHVVQSTISMQSMQLLGRSGGMLPGKF